jgi:ABC-type lipoprotein export system ATPase subunit
MGGLLIRAGTDKQGRAESFGEVRLAPGDVLAVVGPTGSGKSRLLADIEGLAEGDSPSRRVVASADGATPRVARVAQQMQFSVDLRVAEFLALHGRVAWGREADVPVAATIAWANRLVGEPFEGTTPLALLSGGQSRALMIADALHVARADVLLVDEIENAGIDRRAALEGLLACGAVVVLATHDPLVALSAPRRLVMSGGAVHAMIARTAAEGATLEALRADAVRREAARLALIQGAEVGVHLLEAETT